MAFHQTIERVDKGKHDLKAFDCGKSSMNQFLSRFAAKHAELGLSSTWVLLEDVQADKLPVAAYYTLASATVNKSSLPTTQSLPHYPVPVVLLARLAIDRQYQGKGLGTKIFISALRHSVQLMEQGLPAFGLILDVLDEDALKFYLRFGFFEPLTDDPMRLFVGMGRLRQV